MTQLDERQYLGDDIYLYQWFKDSCMQNANALAIAHPSGDMTYQEFLQRVRRLICFLQSPASTSVKNVVIATRDTRLLASAILASIGSGQTFIPVDPNLPMRRITQMLGMVKNPVILHDESLIPPLDLCLSAHSIERISFDSIPDVEDTPKPVRENGHYLYFSSGSTGTPKPIFGRVAALGHYFHEMVSQLSLKKGLRVAQLTTPGFDAFLREIFLALLTGGCLVCLDKQDGLTANGERLAHWLATQQIDLINTVPSVFRNLLDAQNHRTILPQTVLLSGEPLTPHDVARWFDIPDNMGRLYNLYGPTETTLTRSVYPVTRADAHAQRLSIGKPIDGVDFWIADKSGNPVKAGTEGQIMIQTDHATQGYYQQPALTAAAFRPSPKGKPGARVYHTGDIGLKEEDGRYYIFGRLDRQMKRQGVRVQPEELEATLMHHPDIDKAAVLVESLEHAGKTISAWYTGCEVPQLRKWLAERVPTWLQPSRLIHCARFPYLPNGKLDQQTLREMTPQTDMDHAPATDFEKLVCRCFAEVLDVEVSSVKADFFSLGGHSMLALKLLDLLAFRTGRSLTLFQFFSGPTPAQVAEALMSQTTSNPLAKNVAHAQTQATAAQQRIWLIHHLENRSSTYNLQKNFHITQPLDICRLEAAWALIVARHEALCTQFNYQDNQLWQESLTLSPPSLILLDLAHTEARAISKALRQFAKYRFHLDQAPLFRILCIRRSPKEHILMLLTHHIITDAWAQRILERELYQAYTGDITLSKEKPTPGRQVQLAEFSQDTLALRLKQLNGAPLHNPLAFDFPPPCNPSGSPEQLREVVPAEIVDACKARCREWKVTPYQLCLTAFALALHRASGETDILFTVPWFNREKAEDQQVVGMFVETLLLRLRIDPSVPLNKMVHQHKTSMLDALSAIDIPFQELVAKLNPPRRKGYLPLGQISFNYMDLPELPQVHTWKPYSMGNEDISRVRFDLSLVVRPIENCLQLNARFARELYNPATIKKLLALFMESLKSLCSENRSKTSDLAEWRRKTPTYQQAIGTRKPAHDTEQSPTAIELAMLWQALLGISEILNDGDFFSLGGHSMLALELLDHIRKHFGVSLKIADLFSAPELQEMAHLIDQRQRLLPEGAEHNSTVLSPGQTRLWSLARLHGNPTAYNMAISFSVHAPLHPNALIQAHQFLLIRHNELLASFPTRNGKPFRRLLHVADMPHLFYDFRRLDQDTQKQVTGKLIQHHLTKPFNLASGPLHRLVILQYTDDSFHVVAFQHHIISDAQSKRIFRDEFAQVYTNFLRGEQPNLPLLPTSYAAFAANPKAVTEEDMHYWTNKLSHAPLEIPLPFSRPRPARPGFQGKRLNILLDGPPGMALDHLAAKHGCTPYQLILATFSLFLARYANTQDMVLGTPFTLRQEHRFSHVIGFFANTLALRLVLPKHLTFVDYLHTVRDEMVTSLGHGHVPFERIVRELGAARVDTNPLFQVMYTFRHTEKPRTEKALPITRLSTKFDLLLNVTHRPGSYEATLAYDTALFDDELARQMQSHLLRLFHQVVGHTHRRIGDIPILNPQEREQLLQLAHSKEFRPGRQALHHMFERQTRQLPDATALHWKNTRITYQGLNDLADGCAFHLRQLDIQLEDSVILILPRGISLIAGFLGILKTGATVVPLEPNTPEGRLEAVFDQVQPKAVICSQAQREQFISLGSPLVYAENFEKALARRTPAVLIPPKAGAYTIFTSGSTGTPKGVTISHNEAVTLFRWSLQYFSQKQCSVVLGATTICFDVAIFEIFCCLSRGGTLVLVNGIEDAPTLGLEQPITMVCATPSAARLLEHWPEGTPASLTVNLAGEAPGQDILDALLQRVDVRALNNIYGPTECSVYATLFNYKDTASPRTLGSPIAGRHAYVLDANLEPLPQGVIGQIYLGGRGLARGYFQQPQQTATRFIPDPFNRHKGRRLYATGDLACLGLDGKLRFHGRCDQQIKLRGFRIELAEVENLLFSLPYIQASAVRFIHNEQGQRLVGYLVAEGALQNVILEQLEEALKERLPDYMHPQEWFFLSEMPLLPSGKIDRKRLPDPSAACNRLFVPPTTDHERLLVKLWAQMLHQPQVGICDNFFSLGGDSITAILMASEARKLGLLLQPRLLMLHPTIAELAPLVRTLKQDTGEEAPFLGPVTLSPMQRWYFESITPEAGFFTQYRALIAPQQLQERTLKDALEEVVKHHDLLRARFFQKHNQWHMSVDSPDHQVPLQRHRLAHLNPEQQEIVIDQKVIEMQSSLHPEANSLFGAIWFQYSDAQDILVMVAHHLIVDGYSWRIILEDFTNAYEQILWGEQPDLPARSHPYAQWTLALDPSNDQMRTQRIPTFMLPLDFPDATPGKRSDEAYFRQNLGNELTKNARLYGARAYRLHTDEMLIAALVGALTIWTGEDQIVLHLESHGRDIADGQLDFSRTVGWFTQMRKFVFAHTRLGAFENLLKTVKETLRIKAQESQWIDDSSPNKHPAVLFNFMGNMGASTDLETTAWKRSHLRFKTRGPNVPRTHHLEINGAIVEGSLQLRWSYNPKALRKRTVEKLADLVQRELHELSDYCANSRNGAFTPSDFPLARVTQRELALFSLGWTANKRGLLTRLYPTTPMQEGMLFHTLLQPDSGVYFLQRTYALGERIKIDFLIRAWAHVIARHDVLRTSFAWESFNRPQQVVWAERPHPWTIVDLSNISAPQQTAHFDELARRDRERGFALDADPPLRFTLAYLGNNRWLHLLSVHHILVDGWSLSIIKREVWQYYQNLEQQKPTPLPPAPCFGEFIRQRQQDEAPAQAFWEEELAKASALRVVRSNKATNKMCHHYRTLDAQIPQDLESIGKQRGISRFSFIQAAWAIVLARIAQCNDVLFGTTLSGRNEHFEGIERLVGCCIQTLPVRTRLNPTMPLALWLDNLARSHIQREKHSNFSLTRIQEWSPFPNGESLFDTLLVYEQFPRESKTDKAQTIHLHQTHDRANYPLALLVHGSERLQFHLIYERQVLSEEDAEQFLLLLENQLEQFKNQLFTPLQQLLSPLPFSFLRATQIQSPAPTSPHSVSSPPPITALPPLQRDIANIWSEVLAVPQVNPELSFFHQGGNSLRLIRVFGRLQQKYGQRLKFADLFAYPTIAQLATFLEGQQDHSPQDQGRQRANKRERLRKRMRKART